MNKRKFENIKVLRSKAINKINKNIYNKKSIRILNHFIDLKLNYMYDWMGVPVIQFPNDLMVIQELIFKLKPRVILELGIGHGGMLLFYASILRLMNVKKFNVIGVDIFIRKRNRAILNKNKLSKYISLYESNSTNIKIYNKLKKKYFSNSAPKLIILDSNHTKKHVLDELNIYSNLIKKNDYIIVMDTVIEFINQKYNKDKDFRKNNSPYNSVKAFLKNNNNFKVDKTYERKSYITVAKNGFLKKVR